VTARTKLTATIVFSVIFAGFVFLIESFQQYMNEEQLRAVNLRVINTANITYFSTYNRSFAPSLKALGSGDSSPCNASADQSCLIDSVLAEGSKSGSQVTYLPGSRDKDGRILTYEAWQEPSVPNTKSPYFYTDETGIVRYEYGKRATKQSRPIPHR
jgi:hypothetical protein